MTILRNITVRIFSVNTEWVIFFKLIMLKFYQLGLLITRTVPENCRVFQSVLVKTKIDIKSYN